MIIMIYSEKEKILNLKFKSQNFEPYSDLLCEFVSEISKGILSLNNIKNYPELFEFAFWCRKSNIKKKQDDFKSKYKNRKCLGTIFHVPPSNIPTNFAYSFIFGILTGNSNIIRISKNLEPHSTIFLKIISNLKKKKYNKIINSTYFLNYERDEKINKKISNLVDARMIWGSNNTIDTFKNYLTKPNCRDFNFFERFSICMLNADKINLINKKELKNLTHNFYNDTYLTNQAACSSPRIIYWIGKNKDKAKNKFWKNLYNYNLSKKSFLTEFISMDKELFAKINFVKIKKFIKSYENNNNIINIINLKKMPANIDNLKGNNGFFYQFDLNKIKEIKRYLNRNYQTLTYYGFSKQDISKNLLSNNLKGIDRIVPVGQSLNLDLNWDGFDLNNSLTREIVLI